ncbi:MAG TPA: hypothetical protein VK151_00030 [Fluviicola sp.]|nr:hypothetical protein [Fluviicola sp.]
MKFLHLLLFLFIGTPAFSQYSALPITLSLPNDKDTIEEKEPTFVWQCNTVALQNDPRLEQQIVVVELQEDQTPAEAVLINPPLFIRLHLQTGTTVYSSQEHPLEEGKSYAWQVSYLFNGVVIQQSEAWVFTLTKPKEPTHQYLALRRQSDGSVYQANEPVLYIKIAESGMLPLKGTIGSSDGTKKDVRLTPQGTEDQKADTFQSSGEMLCKVDFKDLDLDEGHYVFSWKSPGGTNYKLHFQLNK